MRVEANPDMVVRRTLVRPPEAGWEISRGAGSGQIRESLQGRDFELCSVGCKSYSKILSRGVMGPKQVL